MVRGYDANQARKQALSSLGRHLARRARSKCELCERGGISLAPWEVPPVPDEPDLERTLLICGRCRDGADGGTLDAKDWRFIEGGVWSTFAPVQVTSVRLIRRLGDSGVDWAQMTIESLYLDPEIEAWIDRA